MEIFNAQWTYDQICAALIVIIIGGLAAFIARVVAKTCKKFSGFMEMQDIQNQALRNMIKTMIVLIDEHVIRQGYITNTLMEVTERLYDSYRKLKGNSYIEAIMWRLRRLKPRDRNYEDLKGVIDE